MTDTCCIYSFNCVLIEQAQKIVAMLHSFSYTLFCVAWMFAFIEPSIERLLVLLCSVCILLGVFFFLLEKHVALDFIAENEDDEEELEEETAILALMQTAYQAILVALLLCTILLNFDPVFLRLCQFFCWTSLGFFTLMTLQRQRELTFLQTLYNVARTAIIMYEPMGCFYNMIDAPSQLLYQYMRANRKNADLKKSHEWKIFHLFTCASQIFHALMFFKYCTAQIDAICYENKQQRLLMGPLPEFADVNDLCLTAYAYLFLVAIVLANEWFKIIFAVEGLHKAFSLGEKEIEARDEEEEENENQEEEEDSEESEAIKKPAQDIQDKNERQIEMDNKNESGSNRSTPAVVFFSLLNKDQETYELIPPPRLKFTIEMQLESNKEPLLKQPVELLIDPQLPWSTFQKLVIEETIQKHMEHKDHFEIMDYRIISLAFEAVQCLYYAKPIGALKDQQSWEDYLQYLLTLTDPSEPTVLIAEYSSP